MCAFGVSEIGALDVRIQSAERYGTILLVGLSIGPRVSMSSIRGGVARVGQLGIRAQADAHGARRSATPKQRSQVTREPIRLEADSLPGELAAHGGEVVAWLVLAHSAIPRRPGTPLQLTPQKLQRHAPLTATCSGLRSRQRRSALTCLRLTFRTKPTFSSQSRDRSGKVIFSSSRLKSEGHGTECADRHRTNLSGAP